MRLGYAEFTVIAVIRHPHAKLQAQITGRKRRLAWTKIENQNRMRSHIEFDKCQPVLYSCKGLASCVFCSRATAL